MTALRFLALFLYFSVFCHWGLSLRIIGGHPDHLPYQVSLRLKTDSKHYCGGTIIAPSYVLTAAHCVVIRTAFGDHKLDPRYLFVVAGQMKLSITANSTTRNVAKIVSHKRFNRFTAENDIALLKLELELPLSTESPMNSVPLNTAHLNVGEACVVSGWGSTRPFPPKLNQELHLVDVQVFTLSKCSSMYRVVGVKLHPGMLCAGSYTGGKDACQGDSGGPLVCQGTLAGIISSGMGCADARFPGVYTDIVFYRDWIQDAMMKMDKKHSS